MNEPDQFLAGYVCCSYEIVVARLLEVSRPGLALGLEPVAIARADVALIMDFPSELYRCCFDDRTVTADNMIYAGPQQCLRDGLMH